MNSLNLMKSSLRDLRNYVQWCIDENLACHFWPVSGTILNREEDIYNFPQLLEEIPGWEGILDDSIDSLVKAGRVKGAADKLIAMKDKLLQNMKLYKTQPLLFSSLKHGTTPEAILSEINSAKFMIWGTGSNYKPHFSPIIRSLNSNNFLGYIDNDASKWGHKLDGKTIFSPEQMIHQKPDAIIIASAMRGEIIKQIKQYGLKHCAIY